jgi:hypothetical protein
MPPPHRLFALLRREAAWLIVGLALGFLALPWLLYEVGTRTLGPYEGGSLAVLSATVYGDFIRLRPAAWLLLFGPLLLLLALRLCARGLRRGGGSGDARRA